MIIRLVSAKPHRLQARCARVDNCVPCGKRSALCPCFSGFCLCPSAGVWGQHNASLHFHPSPLECNAKTIGWWRLDYEGGGLLNLPVTRCIERWTPLSLAKDTTSDAKGQTAQTGRTKCKTFEVDSDVFYLYCLFVLIANWSIFRASKDELLVCWQYAMFS